MRAMMLAVLGAAVASGARAEDRITSIQFIEGITPAQAEVAHHTLADAHAPRSLMHSSARRTNGEMVVVDVWNSAADLQRYRELVEPAYQRAGVRVRFDVLPTVNLMVDGKEVPASAGGR